MVNLAYSAMMSLDGFIEDKEGGFEWAEPDGEVHTFINDLEARHIPVWAIDVRGHGRVGER